VKHFSPDQQRTLFVLALLILGLLYLKFYMPSLTSMCPEIYEERVVEILGEVLNPGIHIFRNPPTLQEAIDKAGGFHEVVPSHIAAHSEALETGTLITVVRASHGEMKVNLGRMEARKLLLFSIPLDLNRISSEDLCLIPGIGESLAREIVAYRDRRGGFRSAEELKQVRGIGEKKWRTLATYFRVSQP
jgi:competence protein ComEA